MTTQGVIFDLDGVLTRTDDLHFRAWQQVAHEAGLRFDTTISQRMRGLSRADSLRLILDANRCALDDDSRNQLTVRKNELFCILLESTDESIVLPGVRSLLDELHAMRVPVAVGSSSRNARRIIQRAGLLDMLVHIVDGHDVAIPKPNPETFLRAAAALSVPPSRCVVVEDAQVGVEAALCCSMRVVGVGLAGEVGKAHRVVSDLTELDAESLLAV